MASRHSALFCAVLSTLLAPWPQASDVAIRLVDVTEQAGITQLNISGGASKDYILEVNGTEPRCSTTTTMAMSMC
jgi:hypothetical protein